MKTTVLYLVMIILITTISCDSAKDNDLIQKVDCEKLVDGLLAYDNDKLATEFKKITGNLEPEHSANDQIGHQQNLQKIVGELNKCNLVSSELLCYACIETYPPQSELLVSIDSSGQTVKRIVDILTPDDSSLSFVRVHEYYGYGTSFQKTE